MGRPRINRGYADKKRRQEEAAERNAKWAALTPGEQLHALDIRLGEGEGAAKQRARLVKRVALLLRAP